MHYKTIALELLQAEYPELHRRLKSSRTLLAALDGYASALKRRHEAAMERLEQARPDSDQAQIASEAFELAIEDLRETLRAGSPPSDAGPLSLEAAMAYVKRHTPPA